MDDILEPHASVGRTRRRYRLEARGERLRPGVGRIGRPANRPRPWTYAAVEVLGRHLGLPHVLRLAAVGSSALAGGTDVSSRHTNPATAGSVASWTRLPNSSALPSGALSGRTNVACRRAAALSALKRTRSAEWRNRSHRPLVSPAAAVGRRAWSVGVCGHVSLSWRAPAAPGAYAAMGWVTVGEPGRSRTVIGSVQNCHFTTFILPQRT